jgi:hypothetical protein
MRRQFRFVQAHVFCRHGDRTPGANFFEPHSDLAGKEVAAWLTELLTVQNTRKLSAAFPVREQQQGRGGSHLRRPRDEALGVFGSLTHRGLRQMRALGGSLRLRYAQLLPSGKVDFGDVDCTSSNYRRTMHSAQALLGGLLPQFYDIYSAREAQTQAPRGFGFAAHDEWTASSSSSSPSSSGPKSEAGGGSGAATAATAAARSEALSATSAAAAVLPSVQVKLDQAYINVYPLVPEIALLMRTLKRTMPTTPGEWW